MRINLEKTGLNGLDFRDAKQRILIELLGNEGLSVTELAERTNGSRRNVQKTVRLWAKMGLIESWETPYTRGRWSARRYQLDTDLMGFWGRVRAYTNRWFDAQMDLIKDE